jgi:drug/metabolite transporter (DMT)-like permease
MWQLLALIPFIGWGTGDIFGAYASRKTGSVTTTTYVFIFGMVAMLIVAFMIPTDLKTITLPLLLLNVFLGTFYVLANFLVNEAFKHSNASLVGVIIQSFPALVLILSAVYYRELLSPIQVLAITFLGMVLCSLNFKELLDSGFKLDKGIRLAIIACVIFTIYFTFFREMSNVYGWVLPNLISFATLPLAVFLNKFMFRTEEKVILIKEKTVLFAALASSLLIRSGDIALNYAISNGYAALVSPIAGAAPVLFVIVSAVVFKDKISQQQIIGIATTLVGIIGLSFFV